ncbi:MAG: mechanosensitive ion channel domain-containing protein [Rubrivivax sp.]
MTLSLCVPSLAAQEAPKGGLDLAAGDKMTGHEGTVMSLGTFNTRIRTGMGEELTISNSQVPGDVTKNYSRAVKGSGFIVDTVVTIGYDTPWRQVRALLLEAALRTPGVLADSAPNVF